MLGQFIESFLRNTSAAQVTELFVLILAILFVVSIALAKAGVAKTFVSNTPNLLTSIGILGTFFGIVIGLVNFDAQNIDESIGLLLEGLKTAFITSLVGMGGSITFKILTSIPFFQHKQAISTSKDVGPEILKSLEKQTAHIEALKHAIAGSEESSLAGQVKLFRTDARDWHDDDKKSMEILTQELWRRLETFAEMLSKSATEQVINALKEVITDFNNNLTEQFGENFKALDQSVQKLVLWQEQYRLQIEQMVEQYKQGVVAITTTQSSVHQISEDSRQIPETMKQLKLIMEVNQNQIQELALHLEAFKDIRDKAVEAVPQIRIQIDETVKGITESSSKLIAGITISTDKLKTSITTGAEEFDANVQRLSANLTSTSDTLAKQSVNISENLHDTITELNEKSRNMLQSLTDMGKQVERDTQQIQSQVVESINQMQARLEGALEEVFRAQTREIGRIFESIEAVVRDAVTTTNQGVNEQLTMIDKSMQKEIERVMTEMGQALASISGQFTSDYQQLVTAMNAVVRQRGEMP